MALGIVKICLALLSQSALFVVSGCGPVTSQYGIEILIKRCYFIGTIFFRNFGMMFLLNLGTEWNRNRDLVFRTTLAVGLPI